jgi:thiamine kinase-like enzyme
VRYLGDLVLLLLRIHQPFERPICVCWSQRAVASLGVNLDPFELAAGLGFWGETVTPIPVQGGLTNTNFVVETHGGRYFVRIGEDIPLHGVMRFNELAASKAAYAAGISPEVVYHENGALVLRLIEGRTLEPADIRDPETLGRVVELLRRCHRDIPDHLHGPSLVFWVFQVIRDYHHTLLSGGSRHAGRLPELSEASRNLEEAVGPVELVFGHNDLLASNIIDDGDRLWLVDWDYAGFNSPLFDLGGLASNSELSEDMETHLLRSYFGHLVAQDQRRRYEAMKCASLLRETMWSMVSELHSEIDHDFASYTELNLDRFDAALARFLST